MQRTLKDVDAYSDVDGPHKIIIPYGDQAAKQRTRPAECVEAEQERTHFGRETVGAKSRSTHVKVNSEF